MKTTFLALSTCALVLAGCGDEKTNNKTDTGPGDVGIGDTGPRDSATADTGSDTGPRDSAIVDSAIVDSAIVDSAIVDGGVVDSGGGDAGRTDAGAFFPFGPCQSPTAYTTPGTAIISIGSGNTYSPACLKVARGTRVTFPASTNHRFRGSDLAPNETPFATMANVIEGFSETFNDAGFYPYYCFDHGSNDGNGMAGVVWVE